MKAQKEIGVSTIIRSPEEMTQLAEESGVYKANKPFFKTLTLSIAAGFFIGLAFVFYITILTGSPNSGLTRLVCGLCFSMGLILVVITGCDLFTSTILLVVAKASKKITLCQLIFNWIVVYFGNLAGALLLVLFVWLSRQWMAIDGLWGLNVLVTAQHKLTHGFVDAVFQGILCNIMVCLAVWLSYSGKTLTDKILCMIFPVATFIASGFEHCVANMFIIPLGILIHYFAQPDFWTLTNHHSVDFLNLTIQHFILSNLIPVTIGNIIGGGVVGLTYWLIYARRH